MITCANRFWFVIAAALLSLAAQRHSFAGSSTWSLNPSNGDWNTASNWMPNTVPNGPSDIATFGASNLTNLFINSSIVELDSAVFNSGAPPYTVSVEVYNLILSGTGIVNNSGSIQSFVAPLTNNNDAAIFFFNNASAGNMTSFSTVGGVFSFNDFSSAGSATFDLTDGLLQADLFFWDSTTAADAAITASHGAIIGVYENATAGNAQFTVTTEATLFIADNATAHHAVATCIGGDEFYGAMIEIQQFASAGEGHFTAIGASSSDEKGSHIRFTGSATADNGTFVINGGMAAGLATADLTFLDTTTAANAIVTANGGVSGGVGGAIIFEGKSKGGKSSISLLGNGELDISNHRAPGVTIGSLAGQGLVFLGANTLTIGSNNQSTTFSGVIQDSGGVTKTGTGILTLSGANTYTGSTTVSAGGLVANNKRGSATGAGNVTVQAGSLGGKGVISGAVIVGSGSGSGALLVPGLNAKSAVTLTIQSSLTFNSDGTLQERLSTRQAKADSVLANGVTINGAAQFTLQPIGQKKLASGTSFTLISNTSANPINGAFSNLPHGGTITLGSNTFQANYKGGDGNDLTLTVQ